MDLPALAAEQEVLRRIRLKRQARDALLVNDTVKTDFLEGAAYVNRLYKAILPDPAARRFQPQAAAIAYLAAMIRATNPEMDLSAVLEDLQAVLDCSITPLDYIIREDEPPPGLAEQRAPYRAGEPESAYLPLDLSQIDFEALARQFQAGYPRTVVEKLRGAIGRKLEQMIRLNRERLDYQKQFQQLIDAYNSGSRQQEETFAALLALTQEEQRHLAEGLSEEELALFDLLLHPRSWG